MGLKPNCSIEGSKVEATGGGPCSDWRIDGTACHCPGEVDAPRGSGWLAVLP